MNPQTLVIPAAQQLHLSRAVEFANSNEYSGMFNL
jgi:hypothetical protein